MSRGILRYSAALLFVALLVASCGGEGQQGTRTPPRQPDSTGTTTPGVVAGTDGLAEDAGGESSWSGEGGESGGSEGAAKEIREVEFDYLGGYERARIAFGEGEASGGIPRWSVEKAPEGGYVRLYLPGVTSTQTAGEDLAGLAADAFYVVRRPNGDGLFVDVFALGAFEYRVTELPEAGQLAVDFRPAPGGLACPAVQGEDIVVTQPCEAEEVEAGEPLVVEGYAREPAGSLTLMLLNEEDDPIAEGTARASAGNEAWGHFESSVAVPPSYEGLATLHVVGDGGADDGVSARTEVPVFVGVGQDALSSGASGAAASWQGHPACRREEDGACGCDAIAAEVRATAPGQMSTLGINASASLPRRRSVEADALAVCSPASKPG